MGCVGSARQAGVPPRKRHDVCIASASPVVSSDDFASFYSVWIVKVCDELQLSSTSGRPQLGSRDPKPGSRELQALRLALLASRLVVCIMNHARDGPMPPPGYASEMCWAEEQRIPVVPFYDADRYGWKEVCAWKVELPAFFRSGLGPVRYHRKSHEQAKEQLSIAIRQALAEVGHEEVEVEENDDAAKTEGLPTSHTNLELSRAERQLMGGNRSTREDRGELQDESGGGLADESLGRLDRSDYERAGLVEKRLERTNSLKDITLETALTLLAKQAKGVNGPDLLAPREGGCRLQFVDGRNPEASEALPTKEPAHRVLKPAQGIIKKSGKRVEGGKRLSMAGNASFKQLRLAPGGTDERRLRFAVQQLQQHLDGLRPDDVHELMTVLQCLKDGLEEESLVVRSLRLLSAFLELHLSLHARAFQQGAIPATIAAMRRRSEIDVLVNGTSTLLALLDGGSSPDLLVDAVQEGGAVVNKEECMTLIARSGGIEVVTNGMRCYPACELLQQRGCRCLGLLACGIEDNRVSADYRKGHKVESSMMLRGQARRLIARHGGVALLQEAMRRYPANAGLQGYACMALGYIGSSEVRVKRRAAEGGVVGLIMAALGRHSRDPTVQRWGCAALRHLASNSHANKGFIAKRGGVEKLCEAARSFLDEDWRVVANAFGALCHLASKHPENKQLIFDAGALELVLEALAGQPEAELAMAGCGLLHNLACDVSIKPHIVKLGGREVVERLASQDVSAVRNLANLLRRTLAPPADDGGDPFGAIFATRTPGLVGARRATSRRTRKKAQAALQGIRADRADADGEPPSAEGPGSSRRLGPRLRPAGSTAAREDDAASESGASEASAGSAVSSGSAYSTGSRRPGQPRHSGSRRFSRHWEADGVGSSGAPHSADSTLTPSSSVEDWSGSRDDDMLSVGSSGASEASETSSHISLDANECLGDVDLAGAIEQLGCVRIRREAPKERRKKMKRRRARAATGEVTAEAVVLEEKEEPGAGLAERLRRKVSSMEEVATRKLDKAGQAMRRQPSRLAA